MRGKAWDETGFEDHPRMLNTPIQNDGHNCGVFMLEAASCILNNRDLDFHRSHMPFLRKQLLVELKAGQLRGCPKHKDPSDPSAPLPKGDGARAMLDHHSTIFAVVKEFVDAASKPVTLEEVEAHLKEQETRYNYAREWLHAVLQRHKPDRFNNEHFPRLDDISALVAEVLAHADHKKMTVLDIKLRLKDSDLHTGVDYKSDWLKEKVDDFVRAEREKEHPRVVLAFKLQTQILEQFADPAPVDVVILVRGLVPEFEFSRFFVAEDGGAHVRVGRCKFEVSWRRPPTTKIYHALLGLCLHANGQRERIGHWRQVHGRLTPICMPTAKRPWMRPAWERSSGNAYRPLPPLSGTTTRWAKSLGSIVANLPPLLAYLAIGATRGCTRPLLPQNSVWYTQ